MQTDPDDGVAYASISHAQQMKTTGKARVNSSLIVWTCVVLSYDGATSSCLTFVLCCLYCVSQVRGNEDDDGEGGLVTYAAVNVSSSPAAASADTADVYAQVNKQNK